MPKHKKWSHDETTKLVHRVIELRTDNIEPSILQLIRQAQNELFEPEQRKRLLNNKAADDIITLVKIKSTQKISIKDVSTSQLQIIEENHTLLMSEVEVLRNEIKMLRSELTNMRKRKVLKIGITGLKGDQFQSINNTFDGVKLYNVNVGSIPTHVDYILYMTRFITHSISAKIESVMPKEKIIQINGGLTEVRRQIQQLLGE